MENAIRVYCENIAAHIDVPLGTPLLEVAAALELKHSYPVLAAYVNNRIKELNYRVHTPVSVRFIDISHPEGHRVYQRTVAFLLQQAMATLYPDNEFHIRHSVGSGLYCEAVGKGSFTEQECEALEQLVRDIAAEDLSIQRCKETTVDIIAKLEQVGYPDKVALLRSRPKLYNNIYYMKARC